MIRTAKPSDSPGIAKVIVAAWQTAYTNLVDPAFIKNLEEKRFSDIIRTNLLEGSEKIFVHVENNEVLAFISGKITAKDEPAEVVGLYVRPDRQQTGIGSVLLETMREDFAKQGCGSFFVRTLDGALNNIFYKKFGGVKRPSEDIRLGDKSYPGVYFHFFILKQENGFS